MTEQSHASDRCGATCRDGSPCQNYPVNGSERCRMHGGTNPGAPEDNDNATTHGAFKAFFRNDLTPDEEESINDLVEYLDAIEGPRVVAAEAAAEALTKYKRSGDDRFLREARQWFKDFNLIPNEDAVELSGKDGDAIPIALPESVTNEWTRN